MNWLMNAKTCTSIATVSSLGHFINPGKEVREPGFYNALYCLLLLTSLKGMNMKCNDHFVLSGITVKGNRVFLFFFLLGYVLA